MKPKTTKKKTAPFEGHFYKVLVESHTGNLMVKFWHACDKAVEAADAWCQKFGAKYFYEDPRYFAGGVGCVSFGDEQPDAKLWKCIGDIDGEKVYLPACDAVREMVPIPSRDYALHNTWDTFYLKDHIIEQTVANEDGGETKVLMVPKISFRPSTPQKDTHGRSVAAGNKMRRAIGAEQKRLKLPVMTVQQLYQILDAKLPDGRLVDTTPTFFQYSTTLYIHVAYECQAKGLTEITAQQYRTAQCYVEREEAAREAN